LLLLFKLLDFYLLHESLNKKYNMAKRAINKSNLVREYAAEHPEARQVDIVKALKTKGHDVSQALVRQALLGPSKKGGTKKAADAPKAKRGRKPGSKNKSTIAAAAAAAAVAPVAVAEIDLVSQVLKAADFSKACGGIDAAVAALGALKKISEKMGS
jgi:hypothetical protein